MGEHQSVSYGLKLPARSLAALSLQGSSQWLAGTTSLREENEILLLDQDSKGSLRPLRTYAHPDEVWAIVPHPTKHTQLATLANAGGRSRACIFNLDPGQSSLQPAGELSAGSGAGTAGGSFKALRWHPAADDQLVTVSESRLRRWTMRGASIDMVSDAGAGDLHQLWTAAWDPHDHSRLLTGGGSNIQAWDLRAMKKSAEIEAAHQMPVRDIDFSRQPHRCVSGGDDGRICFWDLRKRRNPIFEVHGNGLCGYIKSAQPVQAFLAHAHWVWQVRYNPFNDALLLSCSSDGTVGLWHTPSLAAGGSSTATPATSAATTPRSVLGRDGGDGKVQSFEDHEDSIYAGAWSTADQTAFASLCYDGRVTVYTVPQQYRSKGK